MFRRVGGDDLKVRTLSGRGYLENVQKRTRYKGDWATKIDEIEGTYF